MKEVIWIQNSKHEANHINYLIIIPFAINSPKVKDERNIKAYET
jgi:hypothetical protein